MQVPVSVKKIVFSVCQDVFLFLCSVNGFVGSPNGSSLGKVITPKSPPPLPLSGNTALPSSRKTDLRVVIPQSKVMMQTLVSMLLAI